MRRGSALPSIGRAPTLIRRSSDHRTDPPPLDDLLNAEWGRAPGTIQNMGRWESRGHPLEKCVEKPPGADDEQLGYLQIFRQLRTRGKMSTKKPLTFPTDGRSGDEGVIFPTNGSLVTGETR